MLDDAYQAGTTAALQDLALRPAAPQPVEQRRFSAWRMGTAAPRGIAAATNEVLGTVADVVKAFGTASALTLDSDPIARATLARESIEEGRRQAKAEIDRGDLMTSGAGDALRAGAEFWAPDPVTAHAAESLVFDFTRVGGKVVGGAVAAGPFGLAAAAGEEGVTQADKLRQKGVGLATRAAVGGVTAAAVGIGAAVPLAGTTLAKTAGLVAAGGPGTFVAQQLATRELLNNAGFGEIANTYDPFDPVGLAVSTLIPAGFGAYGLRAARARSAADAAAADASMLASPEPPSAMTPAAAAARGYVDETMVDAARVSYAVEQRRAGSLADPDDLRAAAQDEQALSQAALQMARGERVEVTALAPEVAPRAVLARMSEIAGRMDEAMADLDARVQNALPETVAAPRAADARAEPATAEPDLDAPAAAAAALDKLMAGDLNAALRIAQEAMAKPGEMQFQPQPIRPPAEATVSPEQARLAELEAANPTALDAEVVTGWDDKGVATERMTARDYLAEVQRAASEEVADARLLEVAVQCALRQ
jgi:hypothetical protein